MTRTVKVAIALLAMAFLAAACCPVSLAAEKQIRIGIIGLDTSHAPAYTKLLNQTEDDEELAGARVVAANVKGSYDLEVSVVRQPVITEQIVRASAGELRTGAQRDGI